MHIIRFFLITLMVLALTACNSTHLYQYHTMKAVSSDNPNWRVFPVYIDKSFSDNEKNLIVAAVSEWNHVLNGNMEIRVEHDIDHTDMRSLVMLAREMRQTHEGLMILGVDHDDELVSDDLEDDNGTLAYVNNLGDRAHLMFVIRDRIGYKNLHKILLHEFGHALGARHVETPSLMYTYYSAQQVDCIDKITASQVATYHGLDLNKMNYCSIPNFE